MAAIISFFCIYVIASTWLSGGHYGKGFSFTKNNKSVDVTSGNEDKIVSLEGSCVLVITFIFRIGNDNLKSEYFISDNEF